MNKPTTTDAAIAQSWRHFFDEARRNPKSVPDDAQRMLLEIGSRAAAQLSTETPATAHGGSEWPARFGCDGPEGSFWTDDSALANKLIANSFDRDEWTVTDVHNPTGLMKCICTGEGSGCTNRCDRGQLPPIPAEKITIRSSPPAGGFVVDGADEYAAYEKWFAGEQGTAYDGSYRFAQAAWLARARLAPAAQPSAKDGVRGEGEIDWPFTYIMPTSKHEYVPKHHAEQKIREGGGAYTVQTRFGPVKCSLAMSVAWEELVEHNTMLEATTAAGLVDGG